LKGMRRRYALIFESPYFFNQTKKPVNQTKIA
jgi:hypothetical protein